jgi:hypothetical protein
VTESYAVLPLNSEVRDWLSEETQIPLPGRDSG